MASSDNIELVADFNWSMESSRTWLNFSFINVDFLPAESQEIKDPKIINIADSFSSKYD